MSWNEFLSLSIATSMNVKAFRCVESQERSATLQLVGNNIEAHDILEGIIEASKPTLPNNCAGLHYLFTTPFRYPPLRWGSRFGSRLEPSLMYAGLDLDVTLGECAFYRFVFLSHMETPPPNPVITYHTSFWFRVKGDLFLKLDSAPMNQFADLWTHKSDFSECQSLGSSARALSYEGIVYESARLSTKRNLALYTPSVITSEDPNEMKFWTCHTSEKQCSFLGDNNRRFSFSRDNFLVCGELPLTAP